MRRALPFLIFLLVAAPAHAAPKLRAGAGQADITPPQTGYYLGGWTRADRLGTGVSTRIYSNALVLQRGQRKVALVAVELFSIPAGLQEDVARKLADRGFDRTTVLLAASHTHSGPGGFANNPTYNTAAPSVETVDDPLSFYRLFQPEPADTQLYTWLVDRIAESVRRADADRAPAAAGWGHTRLEGLTQNRSLEAHLANHGLNLALGQGKPEMDPQGAVHTIDPDVAVLRVDKVRGKRRTPIGAWSNFANHGTVVHSELQAYSGDHHASAWRNFVARVRRASHVPRRQTVVNVYPNSDEGDQTAGIVNVGPAAADRVGRVEAAHMFRAWRRAGRHLSRRPALEGRWTRACFCGRETATGPVDATGRPGAGFFTGSEEGRGPLYDVTGVPFEGRRCPDQGEPQRDKCIVPAGSFPPAVPVSVWRIGDHALLTMPGEATKQVGENTRAAVLAAMQGAGIHRVVIAGLALDFIQYVTTPAEYPWQSYEGASTLYGANEGTFLQERYVELAKQLVSGQPADKPYDYDVSYGVKPNGAPYPDGAASGRITEQPAAVQRLERATLTFTGAPSGHDMPADRAFITAQRRVGKHWRTYATDLGLEFLWRVDDSGTYKVQWEVPLSAPAGRYRFRVTAKRYALASKPFAVTPSTKLTVEGGRLAYPPPKVNVDLTWRSPFAHAKPGARRDRYGNRASSGS
jgi:hypothetical protein